MFSLTRNSASPKRTGSHFALAIALATGAALTAGAIAEPAYAQKKKKDKKAKSDYSKGFVEVFSPIQQGMNAEGADAAAFTAQIPTMMAAVETADDRMAAGQTIYNIGVKTENPVLQLQGVETMLASGKIAPEATGQYNFLAAQLAYNQDIWPKARQYATAALEAGYSKNSPELIVSESYFSEDQTAQGLTYLRQAIQNRIDAGQTPPNDWVRRGLSQAYNNNLGPQSDDFSLLLVQYYPDDAIWADTIAIQRNLKNYEGDELLDLLRLARRVNGLRSERDYEDYVQAADARKLPGEVDALIKQGSSAGIITGGNMFIAEAKETASGRIRADRAELPALERDAMASGANLRTVVAAGDVFLSYDNYAKAEMFYAKALTMPGVDTAEVLNRLGIAQMEQGKYDEARNTFAQVQGARQAIARLWGVYAEQRGGAGAAAATENTAMDAGNTM